MSVYYPPVEQHENVVQAALSVVQTTHYSRAADPHQDAAAEYSQEQLALAARALVEAVNELPEDKQPIDWTKGSEVEPDAIHRHFSLSYANYLVLPRTLLQSMPDLWQSRFVALLDELNEAFQHVPQAKGYKVEAATEHEVSDLDEAQRQQLSIIEDWYRGETPPAGLSEADLAEWEAEHEDPEGPVYWRDGEEIDGGDLVMLPAVDPVPHYDRGRSRVEPRLGGGE